MSSLEHVGFGFPQKNTPDLKKAPVQQEAKSGTWTRPQNDKSEIESKPSIVAITAPVKRPAAQIPDEAENMTAQDNGIYVGMDNGNSINMRVNDDGEAEFNYGGESWSKTPPPSFTKTKITRSLDSLKKMGINTRKHEKSLEKMYNYSAPVSLIAEDDIVHSVDVLQKLQEEKIEADKQKGYIIGPLFISNPGFETYESAF